MRKRLLHLGQLRIEAPAVVAALSRDAASKAKKAEKLGADLVEVRLDLVSGDPLQVMREVREATRLPLIATNRMRQEGGQFDSGEGERIDILCEAAQWADLVDVELRAGGRDRVIEEVNKPVILSYHDFGGMPSLVGLRSIRDKMFEAGSDIAKIAVTPKSLKDALDLLHFLLETEEPMCLIGMGETCRHLRVVAPIYGSVVTYGYIGEETAPGQMSVDELKSALNLIEP
jgi:3-dehydroquinate dehydratase-1